MGSLQKLFSTAETEPDTSFRKMLAARANGERDKKRPPRKLPQGISTRVLGMKWEGRIGECQQ